MKGSAAALPVPAPQASDVCRATYVRRSTPDRNRHYLDDLHFGPANVAKSVANLPPGHPLSQAGDDPTS